MCLRSAGGILLFLWSAVPSLAATEIEPLDVANEAAPALDVYTSEDGLSTEIWNAVGVDSNGFVWAGSASSLARFDGYRWHQRDVEGASSLVRDMALGPEGYLWAIFEGDGLARLGDDGQWRIVQDMPGMRHLFERETTAGTRQLWLSYDDGLARLDEGRWQPDAGNGPDTRNTIATAWTRDLLGRPLQWLARYNRGGLWFREELADGEYAPWRRAPLPSLQSMELNNLATSVSEGREELWILSYTTGLARLDPGGIDVWRAFDSCSARHHPGPQPAPAENGGCRPAALPTEAMYGAEVSYDPDGARSLWLSTRAGLVRMRGERIVVYDRRNGLPSDVVRGLHRQVVDGVNVIWAATEGGLARAAVTDSPWRTVSLLGAKENGTFGVMIEPDGSGGERLWVGSAQRGLALFEDGRWQHFSPDRGSLPAINVRGLWRVEGPDGEMWRLLSLVGEGLYRITDDLEFVEIDVPMRRQAGMFVDHVMSRDGPSGHELWVATFGQGVFRLKDDAWTRFMREDRRESWRVFHLVEQVDGSGRSWLWAMGMEGIARFDGENWQSIDVPDIETSFGSIHALLVNRQERQELWVGTIRKGILRLDVTNPLEPELLGDADVPAPPDPTIYSIVADSRGNIHVCTNNGVQRLEAQADGTYTSRVFRRIDGLVHDECNTNSQVVDRLDRYWVGTLGGLSLFDPRLVSGEDIDEPAVGESRPLMVTRVLLDGEVQTEPGGSLHVPAGTQEVRVDFSLLSGLRERETRYRSHLAGYESEPVDWTADHWRYFTNLAPGQYELKVEAVDYRGVSADPAYMGLIVAPFWWQRRSAQSIFLVGLLLLAAAAVMRYNRGLRKREQELVRVVGERTRELSDANERLIRLSYRDPLTGLANRRRLMQVLKREIARAREKGESLGLIIVDVDHFKPYNDTYGHVAGDVALSAISQALVSATRKRDMVARLGGEEFACLTVNADIESMNVIAERMREKVAELTPRQLGNETDRLTISAGVLVRVPRGDDSLSSLLRDCDTALYEAKHAGRDCVRVAAT